MFIKSHALTGAQKAKIMKKNSKVNEDDERIILPSDTEIFRRSSPSRRAYIPARRNVLLLERMASHGDFVRSYVPCGDYFDVQESGFVEETAECKGERS